LVKKPEARFSPYLVITGLVPVISII